jgi:hypothetical protein
VKEWWEDPRGEVQKELNGMGVKDWKTTALERDKWKKIMEEAKA